MPVHPIGEENRKGVLGSPYAVKDYLGVNPEFGTLEDLRHFVDAAHDLGLHVILDWVANHTAWDNRLVEEHPEWYARDWKGDFRPTPWWDWDDIIDLDYDNPDLRRYMTEAMKFWVREVDVDGYRCDVAGFVPVDFWDNVRRELDEIKPVFMLAEWESRDLHARAFDMTYGWSWNETLHKIAHGKAGRRGAQGLLRLERPLLPARRLPDALRQQPRQERLGGHGVRAVRRRARARDRAVRRQRGHARWSTTGRRPAATSGSSSSTRTRSSGARTSRASSTARLFALKKQHPALWNGAAGGRMVRVPELGRVGGAELRPGRR